MKSSILKIVGIVVAVGVLGFIAIQLVPVNRTNPPVVSEPNWDSPQTRMLAERACFDCHSNETKWPAYAYVAPVSWLVAHDVNEGRQKLNFSDWASSHEDGGDMVEAIQKGEMPMPIYLPMHPQANLTAAEQQQLIAGIQATFGAEGGEGGEGAKGVEQNVVGESAQSDHDSDD